LRRAKTRHQHKQQLKQGNAMSNNKQSIQFQSIQFQIFQCDIRIKNALRSHSKNTQAKRENFAREMGHRSGLLEAAQIFGHSARDFECERWDGSTIAKVQAKVPADRRI
jgi:hypothetical protein